jgi:hypothetical protein
MKRPDTTERAGDAAQPSWPSRLLWFIGLWLAGVSMVAAISYGIRLWIM